ncbi:hypothetical protein BH18ACT1_BH18ACT1_17720 [soil metagenome]
MPGAREWGDPASSNGASSFHAWWELPGRFRAVAVTLEVLVAPVVPRLHFWALQVSFERGGVAHLGLQAHPRHPGGTAVNWGGYATGGGELEGTHSALPSALDNPNTRDLAWRTGSAYRLRVVPGATEGWWRGEVVDLATQAVTPVRELRCPAEWLEHPVVWSEVFAPCDAPSTAVRWSGFAARTPDGRDVRPKVVRATFQSVADGGCSNTDTTVEDGAVVQRTTATRTAQHGARVPLA